MSAVLSNLDRRTITQLGQPRNVAHLTQVLREDPYTETRPDTDVNDHLADLQKRGLVVNLGEHASGSKAALAGANDQDSIPFVDESAQIFEKRLSNPHHEWRLDGDLWLLSNEGLAAIKEPGDNEPDPLTVSEIEDLIRREWGRTLKGQVDAMFHPGPEGPAPSLAGVLLEDEFLAWAKAVSDDCEARWGVRPKMPLAGGSQYSDAYEIALLDAENQKTALGAVVDPWYMTLVIVALTDSDTGTTAGDGTHVPTYTGWARKSVAGTDMNAGSGTGGSVTNANAIIFAACTAGSSTIVGFGNCSASTAGTLRKFGTCTSTTVSTTQTPAQFAAGAYTTTVA